MRAVHTHTRHKAIATPREAKPANVLHLYCSALRCFTPYSAVHHLFIARVYATLFIVALCRVASRFIALHCTARIGSAPIASHLVASGMARIVFRSSTCRAVPLRAVLSSLGVSRAEPNESGWDAMRCDASLLFCSLLFSYRFTSLLASALLSAYAYILASHLPYSPLLSSSFLRLSLRCVACRVASRRVAFTFLNRVIAQHRVASRRAAQCSAVQYAELSRARVDSSHMMCTRTLYPLLGAASPRARAAGTSFPLVSSLLLSSVSIPIPPLVTPLPLPLRGDGGGDEDATRLAPAPAGRGRGSRAMRCDAKAQHSTAQQSKGAAM